MADINRILWLCGEAGDSGPSLVGRRSRGEGDGSGWKRGDTRAVLYSPVLYSLFGESA